jgi:hypothetical protein
MSYKDRYAVEVKDHSLLEVVDWLNAHKVRFGSGDDAEIIARRDDAFGGWFSIYSQNFQRHLTTPTSRYIIRFTDKKTAALFKMFFG